jgi:oligopeptidase B
LAFASDEAGSEAYTIRVRDIRRETDLGDVITNSAGAMVWTADSTAFYYVQLDRHHRASRVYRHQLGSSARRDTLIYEEPDPRYFVGICQLQSRQYAGIVIQDHASSEIRLINLHANEPVPMLVAAREPGLLYDVEHHPRLFGEEVLVLRTNAGGAEDFKLVWVPLPGCERSGWRDLVPHRTGVYVAAMSLRQDWLLRLERENGVPRIVARDLTSGREHEIRMSEEAYALGIEGGFEFATDQLRFTYSSMTTPAEVWDYDLALRSHRLRKRQILPSGHHQIM